ncbi:MAG: DUF2339 domain-containing protein [Chloroflexota bacterium]|nr:MAG: DUF2339 domain-containing protein [Chloroflexota bacterium]
MELLLLLILVVVFATLWSRTGDLTRRLDEAVENAHLLELQVDDLLDAVEDLKSGRSSLPLVVKVSEGRRAERAAAPARAEASPAIAARAEQPVAVAPRARRTTTLPIDRMEAAEEAPLARELVEVEPAGPGLLHRALLKLGLTPPAEGEVLSRGAIEAWLEGRLLAVVGGIALLLGAVFFLSLAFSRGWITEPMRVLIGLGAGLGLLVLGELAFTKLRGILGHVLVAVGLAIVSLALLAATRLYGLVPVEWGLAGAFIAAVAAAAIAIRHDSQLVAGFGLVAVLAAPPALGASPTLITLLFVAVTLVGTTGVALFRTWVWLPPLAFALAAPQLASYLAGDAPIGQALAAIAAFWLVNVVAAGGEETRHATDRLRTTTVTLLLATAAFTVWAGFTVLSDPDAVWRGSFLAALAVAHLALGLFFFARNGDRHPFGLIVAATGVAALSMAVPVQFGGPPVPIAWAAEAVALAWVASLRRHPYSGAVAIALGALAIGHLVAIEYPPGAILSGFDRSWPFLGPEGMTFAFLLGALVVAGLGVPIAWVRASLTVVAGALTLYVFPFELSGPALVAAWAVLAVAALATYVRVVSMRIPPAFVENRLAVLALPTAIQPPVELAIRGLSRVARPSLSWLGGLALIATIGHLVLHDFPIDALGSQGAFAVPYAGPEGAALLAVLAALAASGWIGGATWARLGAAGIGIALLAYSVTFEVDRPHVMLAWGGLVLVALAVVRRIARIDLLPAPGSSLLAIAGERAPHGAALLAAFFLGVQGFWYAGVVPFVRHVTGDLQVAVVGTPFIDVRSYALAIVAATALAAGWTWGGTIARLTGAVLAALIVAWLLPFEVRLGYAVAGWSALALGGAGLISLAPAGRTVAGIPSLVLAACGALASIAVVAPPSRLVVDPSTFVQGLPILTDATVALGAMAIGLVVAAILLRGEPLRRWAFLGAGIIGLYLLSVGLVDTFQRQVGSRPLEELQKEAQVGLSVLWSALGLVGFAGGLRLHRPEVRLSGLGLLGLATIKVFLVDLAALDVAYRVLSLVALGVLLLVSALVYARMQHPHPPTSPRAA